jgi:hypothetical protein
LENGKDLVVRAPGNSRENLYVQGVTVNGKAWNRTVVPHRLLAEGGDIEFAMSAKPGAWGRDATALPPSLTDGNAMPAPLVDLTGPGRGSATIASLGGKAGDLFDDSSRTEAVFATPATVTYVFDDASPGEVSFYTLTSGHGGGHPTAWTLQGSDDGKHWIELDRRSGEHFEWAAYTRPFRLAEPARRRQYRLVITAGSDVGRSSLAEIELLGKRKGLR